MYKASIVTVSFNSVETISDTIRSVVGQDYPHVEFIVVDGGSTDGTLDVVRGFGNRIAKIISEPDRGIYDAMNKGIRAATGDFVGFLNSDDFYIDPGVVRRILDRAHRSNADTVFADLVIVDARDTDRTVRYYDSSRFHPNRLRWGWMPAHPTFFAKRELYERFGGFSLDYRIAADFEVIARLLYKAGASYAYLPEVVVKMRAGGVSTGGLRSSWILNNEIVRACKENGIETSLARVLLKTPLKMAEYFRRPEHSVPGSR